MFNININKIASKWITIEEETLEEDNKRVIFWEEEMDPRAQVH